jgi:hypothetical protein
LDAYEVNILHSEGWLNVCANNGFKLLNLNANYNSALTKMGLNLVTLASEFESPSFLILLFLRVS